MRISDWSSDVCSSDLIGWLAADMGVEVTMGNSFLEVGVNMALALPEVAWVEYSFQNFEHLVERPYAIRDGFIHGSDAPGHGLVLRETARRDERRPEILERDAPGAAPVQQRGDIRQAAERKGVG